MADPISLTDSRAFLDRSVVAVLFVLSGFSALVYQLVWTQQFALVFGATATATAAVLAAYMFGLGAGAALIARSIHRIRRPVLWYAALEVGIALSALLVAPALDLTRDAHIALARAIELEGLASALFFLVFSFVIVGIPTAMMGATLPLLVRFWVVTERQISRGVATLYMVNTLGAAAGTLAAGFVLIPRLGLGMTIWVAVAINLFVAGLAWLWFRHRGGVDLETEPDHTTSTDKPALDRLAVVMFVLIGGSGLVGMAYEVYWTRVLSHPLGGSLYAFAIMLAAFLVGIALGALLAGTPRWSRRASWGGFGVAQLGIAICALGAVHGLDHEMVGRFVERAGLSPGALALIGVTLLPGAILLGVSFPLAVRAVASDVSTAAASSGRVYACNTAGTIIGSVLCGFWLLPSFRFDGTLATLLVISAVLAGIAFTVAGGRWRVGTALATLGVLAVFVWPPPTPWSLLGRSALAEPMAAEEVTYLGVGRSTTVMLQDLDGEQRLTTDGLPESSIQIDGSRPARYTIARWLAMLPATARPEADRALVIGFGAGITSSALPANVTRIDVAEIEPEVIRANRTLSDWRLDDPLADPRLELILNDARNVLTTGETRYDLIISQPSHPWTLGAASLFTAELYAIAKDRLSDDGVFLQWTGLRFVDLGLLRTQIATLNEHFAYVEAVRPPPGGALLLLASDRPIALEKGLVASWQRYEDDWRRAGVEAPGGVLLGRWLDAETTREISADAEVSTDYRNLLMIRSPWILGRQRDDPFAELDRHDVVRDWQGSRDDLYPLRAMLRFRQFDRARLALQSIDDASLRRVAQGLWDLERGNRQQALLVLADEGLTGTARLEALAARLEHHAARPTGIPTSLLESVGEFPALATVADAWRLLRLGEVASVAAIDADLAAIGAEHPIYPMARRLRIAWRQRTGTPELARQALVLQEPHILLLGGSGPRPLIQRAQLAWMADDVDVLLATLLELGGHLRTRKLAQPRALVELVSELSASPRIDQDPRWHRFLAILGELP
ncbi:MAG: fused MFS/spermidine synthase [Acidobacteriota bacterium]